MLSNILVALGVIIMLVGGVILLLTFLNKRASSRATLTAIIDIYPSGKSTVEFIPYSNIEETKLMKIALMYAAKVRYVLKDENPQILEAYRTFLEGISPSKEKIEAGEFVETLSDFTENIQKQQEFSAATKTGERFTVRLIEGRMNQFVHNDLPFRGLAINIPISVMLLLQAVAIRLTDINGMVFETSIRNLNELMFNEETPQLGMLNRKVVEVLDYAEAHYR